MAKSNPIGVRFDLEKLELIKKEQNLKSTQSVVNYLLKNYQSLTIPKLTQIANKNEPKEGSMAFVLKYGCSTYEEIKNLNHEPSQKKKL
jgi:hypothetical protein